MSYTSMNAHDLIALGEFKDALSSKASNSSDEILRLPLLSRLLAASQLQASIPVIDDLNFKTQPLSNASSLTTKKISEIPKTHFSVDETVWRLEAVAAAHPAAEGMDVLITYLAPEACRNICKYGPIKRKRSQLSCGSKHDWDGLSWDAQNLKDFVKTNLDNSNWKKKTKYSSVNNEKHDVQMQMMEEEFKEDIRTDHEINEESLRSNLSTKKDKSYIKAMESLANQDTLKTTSTLSHSSFLKASSMAGDSKESAVQKMLMEICELVLKSLNLTKKVLTQKPLGTAIKTDNAKEKNIIGEDETNISKNAIDENNSQYLLVDQEVLGGVTLNVKSDSLLAEPSFSKSLSSFSVNDVSTMLPSLIHHCPILRYRHIAGALCRAALPKTPDILLSMAANNPSSISPLIRGCLDAYNLANKNINNEESTLRSIHHSIIITVEKAVEKIATISKKEASNIMNRLIELKILSKLFIKIAIENDGDALIVAILGDFSSWKHTDNVLKSNTVAAELQAHLDERGPQLQRQGSNPIFQKSKQHEQSMPVQVRSKDISRRQKTRRFRKKKHPSFLKVDNQSWLIPVITNDYKLAIVVRKCIMEHLTSAVHLDGSAEFESVPWGKLTLYLKTYCLLLAYAGLGAGSSAGSGSRLVEESMSCVTEYVRILLKSIGKQPANEKSCGDSFLRCALSTCIMTCCRFPPISDAKQEFFMGGTASAACLDCLTLLFEHSISKRSDVFFSRVAGFLASEDASELMNLIWTELKGKNEGLSGTSLNDFDINAFFNTCRWASCKVGLEKLNRVKDRGITEDAMLFDASGIVDAIRRSQINETQVRPLLSTLFNDAEKCNRMFSTKGASTLISEAVIMISKGSGIKLPLVLPRDLDILVKESFEFYKSKVRTHISLCKQFILQLLYAFEFLDRESKSPFAIDPRVLPLENVLSFLEDEETRTSSHEVGLFYSRLKELMDKWCPEVRSSNECNLAYAVDLSVSANYYLTSTSPQCILTLDMVRDAIRHTIHTENCDPSGCRAEAIFLQGRVQFVSSSIDRVALCAFLSRANRPPPFYTYATLCKDPLVLLKCNIKVWRMRGTRRIILSILQRLMEANTHYVHQTSPDRTTALELIYVRDLLVARSIIIAASGSYMLDDKEGKGAPIQCQMTISILRSMISRRLGLTAMIIKQGIPERAVDWMVEHVPEVFLDARALTSCIFERNSLTSAERLVTADAGVRIAIAHGSQNEKEAVSLVYESLACLVNSFPLVIGPVEVSVSALCEEDGEDITQQCRRSAFRILNALQHVSGGREILRNEVSMALSKIATLCKSETVMNNNAGPGAMKRKSILKDIWETVTRVANVIEN